MLACISIADLAVSIENYMIESFNASDRRNDTSAIMIPPNAFGNETMNGTEAGVVFSVFSSPDLYPLGNGTTPDFAIASNVISATVIGSENMISSNITIVLKLNYEVTTSLIL